MDNDEQVIASGITGRDSDVPRISVNSSTAGDKKSVVID